MKRGGKWIIINLFLILLALELKNFFDKGGQNNDLAYALLKIIILICACYGFANFNDLSMILINKLDEVITPRKLLSKENKISKTIS